MRKAQKKQAEDFVRVLEQAHGAIRKAIETNRSHIAMDLLEQCQDGAIGLGELVESSEGQDCRMIPLLEKYCEFVYQVHEEIGQEQAVHGDKVFKNLRRFLIQIENSLRDDVKVRIEAVFLPYKASMWDSLESVWKAADEDPECDAYVIPIPYFDRNPDGTFREAHYEGDLYPDYVPVADYRSYDFAERRPDMIFIHNPYDNYNHVTSVHPFFYSENLKQFTDKLVYIPYFILGEIDAENQEATEAIKHFCVTPGVFQADKVIVQSESMRQAYINVLTREAGESSREIWEKKILGIGSPKIDKVMNTRKEKLDIPEEWLRVIEKPDGSWKKIIFYNTSVSALLTHGEEMLKKMESVFQVFKENREEVALLWRPHPLIKATIESMRPWLWKEYEEMVARYKEEGWGIYDDTADMDRAVSLSDGYYGDESSIVRLYQQTGKPVMIQNPQILKSSRHEYDIAAAEAICRLGENYYFAYMDAPILCKMNRDTLECELLYRFCEGALDGRIYKKIVPYKDKLFLIPFLSDNIGVYNMTSKDMKFIRLNEDYADVRDPEWKTTAKFEDVLVKGKVFYMIPHNYHALVKMDMETLALKEIPLGKKGTEIFCYCNGSACLEKSNIIFPILSEGSICVFDINSCQINRVYPTGEAKRYNNIFSIENKIWLIPEKIYKGIDIWNIETMQVERTLYLSEEINALSEANEKREHEEDFTSVDFKIGFVMGRKLYLLPYGLDFSIIIDLDSESAVIWNLPNEYKKENFPLYQYFIRNAAVLLEDKAAIVCGLRGEWVKCQDETAHVIQRHAIWKTSLINSLVNNGLVCEGEYAGRMDLNNYIKTRTEERKTSGKNNYGKIIYQCISSQNG